MPLKQRPCALLDFDCRKRRSVGDYTTKPKKPKKLRRFKNTTSLPARKPNNKGKPTKKKQGTLFVPDSQKHWQKHSRKPNNNPSTRGTELKTHK